MAKRYEQIFAWYVEAMGRAHFTELIRPVHPEFYFRRESAEAAAALAEARQAAAAIDQAATEGMRVATDLRRQRSENHLHSLVECAVSAAASVDPTRDGSGAYHQVYDPDDT